MRKDRYAMRNRDAIFDENLVLQIQKQLAAQITMIAHLKVLIIVSSLRRTVMHDQGRVKTRVDANAPAESTQRRSDDLGGHEHKRHVDSLSAINSREESGPPSKQEVKDLQHFGRP